MALSMESAEITTGARFTSTVRRNGKLSYIHIPKDLASIWGLQDKMPVEILIVRTYPVPKREKK